ncbi:Probable E3 ubiquitin-protein ligase HIP1 [Linum grandiflorum]
MDDYSSKKRNDDGLFVSRKASSLAKATSANNKHPTPQFCTRIGCSGRLNSAKATQIITYSSRPLIPSSSTGKQILPTSTRANIRNKFPSPVDSDEPDVDPPSTKLHKGDQSCSATITTQVRSTSLASCRLSNGDFQRKAMLGNPNTLPSTSCPPSLKNTIQPRHSNVGRNGLRNFRCNSVTDAVSSSSSSSSSSLSADLNLNKRKNPLKEKVFHGESSSSARGKKKSGSSPEGQSSTCRVSISDARRARIGPTIRDNPVSSVRTRRSVTGYSYNRSLGSRNNSEAHSVVPQVPDHDISFDPSNSSLSHHFFVEPSIDCPSLSRIGSSSRRNSQCIRPSSPAEIRDMRSLLNRESSRRYNMDGITEVLLALEGIGQDEELTYEQLLVLETNLFLSGLNLHDQHRDMRLDIDNMSYEELLALEDRMGSVSTGVKDEELARCLKSSIYQLGSMEGAFETLDGTDTEDIKCSICQEEYEDGDEVGGLQCEHKYHMKCIHQWLRLKNWCPVCKASAVTT